MKDLTGKKFGYLTVLECAGKPDGRRYSWKCQCDCGNIINVPSASLCSGNTKSCGCQKNAGIKKYNMEQSELNKIPIGTRFGKLVIIEDLGFKQQVPGHNRRYYRCICDCGAEREASGNELKSGNLNSCGHCLISKGEEKVKQLLVEYNIKFEHNKMLSNFYEETNKKLRFDFIIYDENNEITRIIEVDGIQHYQGPDKGYWSRTPETLEDIQKRDFIKNSFCLKHNIPLVRIPYYQIQKLVFSDLFSDKYLIKEVKNYEKN